MSHIKIGKFLVVAIAAALVLAVPASASLVETFTTSTPITATSTDWGPLQLTFQQFDPSLGSLVSVQLQLSGVLDTNITVTDTGTASTNGNANTTVNMFIYDTGTYSYSTMSGAVVSGNNLTTGEPSFQIVSPTYNYNIALSGGTASSGPLTKTGTFSETYTSGTITSEFTGLGTFSINANTLTGTSDNYFSGNSSATQTTTASLTGTVTYTYDETSTPEPASLGLIGVGLAGLGLWARRRTKAV